MRNLEHEQELRESFAHFDTDGNGVIDFSEFVHLLRSLSAAMSLDEMQTGFEELDRDGSGGIEFGEFLDWWSGR